MAETLATSPLPTQHQNPEPDQPPADHSPPPPPPPTPHTTAATNSGSPTKSAPLEPPSAPPPQVPTNPVGPSSAPAAGSEKGPQPEPERQTFSQLLAGAMASGSSPKITGLPRLTVPCFVSPQGFLDSPQFTGQFGMSHQAALASVTAQAQMQLRTGNLSPSPSPTLESISLPSTVSLEAKPTESEEKVITPEPESLHVSECEQKSQSNHDLVRITSGDGYNWRKYGQKQVKASENSRSYYRCTHSNCTAKKKVEHCQDGRVYDITYQGEHSHEPPQKVKSPKERLFQRSQISVSLKDEQNLDISSREPNHCSPKNVQDSRKEKSEQLHCSSDCEVDPNTYTEGDGEQPDPKRRLCEVPVAYIPSLFKTARDAKIIVQSSCVEGPGNDGYRWRKYGQKNVKGSSSPRSYYKCTHTGCPVRKHVERAEDAKTFITTYEGHHNHGVPPKKSGSDAPASVTSDEQKQASNSVETTPSECKTIDSVAAESQVKPLESATSLSGIGLEPSNSKDKDGGNGSDIVQRPLFDKSQAVVPVKNS